MKFLVDFSFVRPFFPLPPPNLFVCLFFLQRSECDISLWEGILCVVRLQSPAMISFVFRWEYFSHIAQLVQQPRGECETKSWRSSAGAIDWQNLERQEVPFVSWKGVTCMLSSFQFNPSPPRMNPSEVVTQESLTSDGHCYCCSTSVNPLLSVVGNKTIAKM